MSTTSIKLHPPTRTPPTSQPALPTLLQTPSGLAILELQGSINVPAPDPDSETPLTRAIIGRLEFPEYRPGSGDEDTAWMRRVYMYVGQHQRLAGEVKKLPRAMAVVRRRVGVRGRGDGDGMDENKDEDDEDEVRELEVVEVVKYKLVFSQRPEPVGST